MIPHLLKCSRTSSTVMSIGKPSAPRRFDDIKQKKNETCLKHYKKNED